MSAVCFAHIFCPRVMCGKMVVDVDGMDARRTAVMTVTIGGGDGFEPIGIAHANGCPLEPCYTVYPFYTCTLFTRVRSLTRLRRIYTRIPLHRTSFLHA